MKIVVALKVTDNLHYPSITFDRSKELVTDGKKRAYVVLNEMGTKVAMFPWENVLYVLYDEDGVDLRPVIPAPGDTPPPQE